MDDDYEEDEEEYEEEDYEEVPGAGPQPVEGDDVLRRSLALGFLAMVPMFAAYELALLATPGDERSTSELVLFRLLSLFGEQADLARWIALVTFSVLALVHCLRHHWALGPRLVRIVIEGTIGAVVIGPILIALIRLFGESLPPLPLASEPSGPPDLAQAGFVFGAGAYEEVVFRVGIYSALYFVALRVGDFFGMRRGALRWSAEAFGLFGSAALFSAFHLALFVAWLGPGGEDFDLAVFTYRALAGILLGLIFRWRGPGVAAWTHGMFNFALLLGAGPDVFL
jgi:hypothetical protein